MTPTRRDSGIRELRLHLIRDLMKQPYTRLGRIGLALALSGLLCTAPVFAQADDDPWAREKWESRGERFVLGVGFVYAKFDTSAKFTDKATDLSVYIDAEGSLSLPETDAVPAFYGGYRFSQRHSVVFSYYQIRREVTFVDRELEFEGVHVAGSARLRDRTRFYNVSYGNTLFKDERSRVSLKFGIYGLDLKYTFDAEGQITIDDETELGALDEEASLVVPLPVVGFDFWFAFTPKWSINPKISFVGGSYQDVTAGVFSTTLLTRYQFSRRLGMLFGVSYFDANVTIEDNDERTDLDYGYSGAFLGLHLLF